MTQSKKDDILYDINIDDNSITIDLNNTYGATTTYWDTSNITTTNSIFINSDATTVDIGGGYSLSGDFGTIDLDSWRAIRPDEVEKMCKEYPALEKVWRNFKAVYDMVKQDYEGKKQAGEIDDDELPF